MDQLKDKPKDESSNSESKSVKIVIVMAVLITILGLILRVIAAQNIGVAADDMHHTVFAINFLESGKMITYEQSTGLWHAITDIAYHIFGVADQLTSRFASIFFGTLTILIMFLFTKELFRNNKGKDEIALIAAFLLAVSPFHLRMMVAEMDVMAMFFILFGAYLFIKGIRTGKNSTFALAGLMFGLAIMTKIYSILFIPGLLIYYYFNYGKKGKEFIWSAILFLGVIFIFCIPVLTSNYLLYKDKGFLDLQFTRITGLGKNISQQYYGWDHMFDAKSNWLGLFFGNDPFSPNKDPTALYALTFILYADPLVFILGLFGMIGLFREMKKAFLLLFMLIIIPHLYLASIMLMGKHYLFLLIFLIPAASFVIFKFKDKYKWIKCMHIFIFLFLASMIYMCANSVWTNYMFTTSSVAQLMDYKDAHISADSFTIVDSRIYRGRMHWMMNGRDYIESAYLQPFFEASENSTIKEKKDVYFIECVLDDCGWGSIAQQPEYNKSLEQIADYFKQNGQLVAEISDADGKKSYFPFIDHPDILTYRVYKTQMEIGTDAIYASRSLKNWLLYPIGYDETYSKIFDKYEIHNDLDKTLDLFAHSIFYFAILGALFFSQLIIIEEFYRINKEKEDENESIVNDANK